MTSPAIAAQVLAANRRFYDALEALDAGAMEACWASSPAPACVHPGGPWQRGWEEVAAGWDAIMSATGYIEFEIADAVVSIVDPVAWVTCVERRGRAVRRPWPRWRRRTSSCSTAPGGTWPYTTRRR